MKVVGEDLLVLDLTLDTTPTFGTCSCSGTITLTPGHTVHTRALEPHDRRGLMQWAWGSDKIRLALLVCRTPAW